MDFQKDVIEKSYECPVVVDFWAEWCGPCRVLGPIIEDLASKAGDRWQLVKVDADKHPELSQKYHVRGIPSVKMFSAGEVIADFTGALPAPAIEKWLDENIPDERKKELQSLIQELDEGEADLSQLLAFCEQHEDLKEARLEWAKRAMFTEREKALEFVSSFHLGEPLYPMAEAIKLLLELSERQSTDGSLPDQHLMKAAAALKTSDWSTALESVVQAVMINKSFEDGIARKAGLAMFTYLGEDHPISKQYRRKFDMALF